MRTRTALQVATVLGGAALAVARVLRSMRAIGFAGKVVVIFGGSRGLGLVMARELAHEGARLVLVARDADELERARTDICEPGMTVDVLRCDVTEREQVELTIARVVSKYGTIDVL